MVLLLEKQTECCYCSETNNVTIVGETNRMMLLLEKKNSVIARETSRMLLLLEKQFVGCLTSQQHASVSLGQRNKQNVAIVRETNRMLILLEKQTECCYC